jgi:ribosome-associated translation inhibitor RaiA
LNYDAFDIKKLRNENLNLAAFGLDLIDLAASVISPINGETRIKLNVEANLIGKYQFEFTNMDNFDAGVSVNLIDKYIEMTIVFRHNDPENILTADHLQEFLAAKDKIIEKIDKKQTNLVSILSTLSESVNATEKKVDSILKKNPESVVPGSVPPSKYTYNN